MLELDKMGTEEIIRFIETALRIVRERGLEASELKSLALIACDILKIIRGNL
jgi:hypothetical protein